MFETPYQTTPCSRFVMEKTTTGIRKLEINEELVAPEGTPAGIKVVPPGVIDFQPFLQPITKAEIPTLEADVVIDGRSLLRADRTPAKSDAWNHALLTAQLTQAWANNPGFKRDLLNVGDLAPRTFIGWIASAISLRLGLDFGQTTLVRACCAVYYIQLFSPLSEHSTAEDRDRLVVRAARNLSGVDPHTLASILVDIPPMNTIADFIEYVKKVVDSPRTEQLSVALLYTALGFSWGPAYREAVAVALEYPPVFIALTFSSVNERSYSKTGLGKVIERVIARGNDKEFIKNVNHLVGKG